MGGFSSLCRDVEISLTSNRQRRKDKMQAPTWGNDPTLAEQQSLQRAGLAGDPDMGGTRCSHYHALLLREIPVAFPPGGVSSNAKHQATGLEMLAR